MAQGGCLAGKVVVVTGAGRGIGREIALLAAGEGGKVVVNDLGGSAEGEGSDTSVAQQVVNEIAKAGGAAVANGDSVADPQGAERIIKTAIDNFGRIDCVVNNAGILRDRIFHRMSAVDWDAVIKVHLYGAFYMSKAAAPYFKEQSPAPSSTSPPPPGWSATSARPTMPRPRWVSSGCRSRSRSTWRASTCAPTACRRSPGRG
jgi:NAD(P)-dependent dehydrogenase (short-subunit alcohol dehydrogenase family)